MSQVDILKAEWWFEIGMAVVRPAEFEVFSQITES